MPRVINPRLNITSPVAKGGSNAVYGVDGSPVQHDIYFKSPHDSSARWHTVLFVPYGRGGSGFSVLDVTIPTLTAGTDTETGTGPLHMFSIYNDSYNKEVIRVDHKGKIIRLP